VKHWWIKMDLINLLRRWAIKLLNHLDGKIIKQWTMSKVEYPT